MLKQYARILPWALPAHSVCLKATNQCKRCCKISDKISCPSLVTRHASYAINMAIVLIKRTGTSEASMIHFTNSILSEIGNLEARSSKISQTVDINAGYLFVLVRNKTQNMHRSCEWGKVAHYSQSGDRLQLVNRVAIIDPWSPILEGIYVLLKPTRSLLTGIEPACRQWVCVLVRMVPSLAGKKFMAMTASVHPGFSGHEFEQALLVFLL